MIGSLACAMGTVAVAQSPRTLEFSGYTWELRRSDGLASPGPNRFLDNPRTIWVEPATGDMHLRLWNRRDNWYAAEVTLDRSLGYGTYILETVGKIGDMDPELVLGMFTYDHNPEYNHREIDIEYSYFGSPDGPNAQFAVQPFDSPGNRYRFNAAFNGTYSTHLIRWAPDAIEFASYHGHRGGDVVRDGVHGVNPDFLIDAWTFDGDVPPPGEERLHINLWLYRSDFPSRDHEVVIRSFVFVPFATP